MVVGCGEGVRFIIYFRGKKLNWDKDDESEGVEGYVKSKARSERRWRWRSGGSRGVSVQLFLLGPATIKPCQFTYTAIKPRRTKT